MKKIPDLENCFHTNFLSLYAYFHEVPEKFFSVQLYDKYLRWLKEQHSQQGINLKEYIGEKQSDLNRSFRVLVDINRYTWHDFFEQLDEYDTIKFIDREIHPTLLRLWEVVFFPFVHLLAYFSRIKKGKPTGDLALFNVIEEIQDSDFSELSRLFDNTVRNGIAHGGITFLDKEISYRDIKGNEKKLNNREIIALLDDLLDTCNALSLALKVFLFRHVTEGYCIPQQLLLQELQAETDAPWWHIEGFAESKIGSIKQLIIFIRPNTIDYPLVQYFSFFSAVLAEFFAPEYDRYFLSLRCSKAMPGWAAFDGRKLRAVRENKPNEFEDYEGVLENDLVFYVPKLKLPHFITKFGVLVYAFKVHWYIVLTDMKNKRGLPQIIIRETSIHRNGWRVVLNSSVVIDSDEIIDKGVIRESCRRIIRSALSNARKHSLRYKIIRYLPLGYARISIFKRDFRKRKLTNYGLGSDLIGTIELKKIRRIQAPDIFESTIEMKGRYRIAWNSAWIKYTRATNQ
ncbi:hypothetical protein HQ587_03555 [bacterium]|nr:hypothetical protein [bacterium]